MVHIRDYALQSLLFVTMLPLLRNRLNDLQTSEMLLPSDSSSRLLPKPLEWPLQRNLKALGPYRPYPFESESILEKSCPQLAVRSTIQYAWKALRVLAI